MAAPIVQTGVYYIQNVATGTVIDLDHGYSANGSRVQCLTKHEPDNVWAPVQLWLICQVGNDPVYTIQNTCSRTYLDLTQSLSTNGTPIIGFEGTDNPNQRWIITRNPKKTAYVIMNVASKTYVNLQDGSSAEGAAVNGWAGEGAATANPNQLWHIVRA